MKMTLDDFKSADVFDSRDMIERIAEITDALEADYPADSDNADERAEAEAELATLQAFATDADSGEWRYGQQFIADSYFEDYAQELAEDISAIDDAVWPFTCIDWAQAARELQMDYTSVTLGGYDFWTQA